MSVEPTSWPRPPYYVAILSVRLSGNDIEGYAEMGARMLRLAESQPGYLGRESMNGPDGRELTLVYYDTEDAIRRWREHTEHLLAQRLGRKRWYESYEVRIARVERAYRFTGQREGRSDLGD